MNKKKTISVALALLLLVISFTSIAATAVYDNFKVKDMGAHRWYNYDFSNSGNFTYDNVDWPISLIYWGSNMDTNKDLAKSLSWYWDEPAGSMRGRYYDEAEGIEETDSDEGKKSFSLIPDWNNWHARFYADVDTGYCYDMNYLGLYVVASTHKDYIEYIGYGYTNASNYAACEKAAETLGWVYCENNFYDMENEEPLRYEPSWGGGVPYHVWDFDGYAEGIDMSDM